MSGIDIDDLADAVMQELMEYSDEVIEGIKEDVKRVAEECAQDIRENAPKVSGKYKKSWKAKTVYESNDDIRAVIHSQREYRRTHLLEHGHAKRGGGRVEGKPHIRPAEERAEKKLLKKVKITISGGNS